MYCDTEKKKKLYCFVFVAKYGTIFKSSNPATTRSAWCDNFRCFYINLHNQWPPVGTESLW